MKLFFYAFFIIASSSGIYTYAPVTRQAISSLDSSRTYAYQVHIKSLFFGLDTLNPGRIEVPFRLSGGLILIDGQINKENGRFIFDSGASNLIINAKYLQSKKQAARAGKGITGQVRDVQVSMVEQVRWNEFKLEQVKLEAFDMSHIEQLRQEKILGLLGFHLFKDYEVVLDYKSSKLIMYQLNRWGQRVYRDSLYQPPKYIIPFSMQGHVPIIKAQIGKFALLFGLDTGAETSILDSRVNAKVLAHFKIQKRGILRGAGQDRLEILHGKLLDLKIKDLAFPPLPMILGSMKSLNKAYDSHLDGVLGFHFLMYKKTAINFIKQEVYMWEDEKPQSAYTKN